MQFKNFGIAALLSTSALAAYAPPDPWSTLTPTTTLKSATADFTKTFGLSVQSTDAKINEKETVCKAKNQLSLVLKDGILKDSSDRIGSIVANHQFQFDGPVPQAGALLAAGWAVENNSLVLGDETTFYQCLSGDFYNLYDEKIGEQCHPVKLQVVPIIDC